MQQDHKYLASLQPLPTRGTFVRSSGRWWNKMTCGSVHWDHAWDNLDLGSTKTLLVNRLKYLPTLLEKSTTNPPIVPIKVERHSLAEVIDSWNKWNAKAHKKKDPGKRSKRLWPYSSSSWYAMLAWLHQKNVRCSLNPWVTQKAQEEAQVQNQDTTITLNHQNQVLHLQEDQTTQKPGSEDSRWICAWPLKDSIKMSVHGWQP